MTSPFPIGIHVAVAMDGNGRWAEARGLPRLAGHRAGVDAVRRVVAVAPSLGIGTLTLFAFSSDNWRRPAEETAGILAIVEEYLRADAERAHASGVRLRVLGRRSRFPRSLVAAIAEAEERTADGRALLLQIAIDYSARDTILAAAARGGGRRTSREEFSRALGAGGDVDLLVRTGGERRLSDFLLWEAAYAELLFLATPWPDFDGRALEAAVRDFRRRERRFGGLVAEAAS